MTDGTPTSLAPGTRLGPYTIVALIGRGGMGEVYRARDTRLGRDVALKTLPAAVAHDAIRRARFEREAQAIAQLAHPHICAIHDVGEVDHITFIVMTLVEGESLDARLRRGALPMSTSVTWAIQIASAIGAAHRRGLIHRDLKPANIMVGAEGITLLDFGLAKWLAPESEASDATRQASTASLTGDDRVVGTVRYMAPEQLEQRAVDARTDIFAFGATFYEMLTGRHAFEGSSAASVSAAILTVDPPAISATGSGATGVPEALDHVVRRSLAKDPEERWQTAHDIVVELQWIQEGRGRVVRPLGAGSRIRRGVLLAVTAALAVAGLFWAGWSLHRDPPLRPDSATTFEIAAPSGARLFPGYGVIAVSPDAHKIAFLVGIDNASSRIFVRDLADTNPRLLPDTDGAGNLFWSPDSKSIGYFVSASDVRRVDIGNNAQVALGTVPVLGHGDGNPTGLWLADGRILIPRADGLHVVNAATGAASIASTENLGQYPALLPDGSFLTAFRKNSIEERRTLIRRLDRALDVSLPISSNAVYADGYIVYSEGGAIVARAFDARTRQFTGPAARLVEGVQNNPANGRTAFDVAGNVLAYRPDLPPKLVWRNRDGGTAQSIGETGRDWNPEPAPDDSGRIAVDRYDPASKRWGVITIDTSGRVTRVTPGLRERFAVWSPDAKWIAYWAGSASMEIRRVHADGSGDEELLVQGTGDSGTIPDDWSADGQTLLYQSSLIGELWALPLTAPRTPARVTPASVQVRSGRFSPDGHWVAYAQVDRNRSSIWVQEFPSGGSRHQVSPGEGAESDLESRSKNPVLHDRRWSSDGPRHVADYGRDQSAASRAVQGSDGQPRTVPSPVHVFRRRKALPRDGTG